MDIRAGDVLVVRKPHPCSADRFEVLGTGMDVRLRCTGCGHEMMIPRIKAEKNIKKITRPEENPV